MGKERLASFYDEYYKRRGVSQSWAMAGIMSYIIGELKKRKVKVILDIGCGDGAMLAQCKMNGIDGSGFDFSFEAIKICKEERNLEHIWVGDARKIGNFTIDNDAYLCLEVLEHIEDDIKVIQNINSGSLFIFSVPSWANPGSSHVRCFMTDKQIRVRYENYIDIKSIKLFKTRRVVIGRIK